MTLAELFHAINLAGVRLANVAGRLELRGPAIPPAVRNGAAEHKEVLLSLLPPSAWTEADSDGEELAEERAAIQAEVSAEALARALAEWDAVTGQAPRSCAPRFGPCCRYADHRLVWRSVHDVLVCAACHPPASLGLVREWEWWLSPEEADSLTRWVAQEGF